jgi:hypothetical protein
VYLLWPGPSLAACSASSDPSFAWPGPSLARADDGAGGRGVTVSGKPPLTTSLAINFLGYLNQFNDHQRPAQQAVNGKPPFGGRTAFIGGSADRDPDELFRHFSQFNEAGARCIPSESALARQAPWRASGRMRRPSSPEHARTTDMFVSDTLFQG